MTSATTLVARTLALTALLLLCGGPVSAQNLLLNPGCETADTPPDGNPPPSWTEVSDEWSCLQEADFDPSVPVQEGSRLFVVDVSTATAAPELRQDVDVSAFDADIDNGIQEFTFIGYVRRLNDDETQIVVEYRDAANTTVLDTYDSGATTSEGAWQQVSDTRTAPVGTRTVRVRLICSNDLDVSSACDGFFDGLSFVAGGALPVELTAFDAVTSGAAVQLRWATASETNNAGFEVQHRTEAAGVEAWEVLAFVEGRGTTLEAQRYSHRLEELAPGTHVFRLKQVDYDGAFSYSPQVEVTLEVPGAYHLSSAYPNPFNPQTRFSLAVARRQHVRVEVFDVLGRPVARLYEGVLEAQRTHTFTLEAPNLPSGTYLYRAVGEHFAVTKQVTLLK